MESSSITASNKNYLYLICILLILAYLPVLYDLVSDWATDGNYSHGFLVPIISFYLIWRKRRELAAMPLTSNVSGLVFIILGMVLFILGNAASEYFTARLSLVVCLFGLVLYLFGQPILKRTWFEIFLLLFMIPIPYVIYFSATFPMQLLASKVTVAVLNIIGMPVVRDGNIIRLPNQSLEVAEACSGMRSLVSLLALGAIYAYLTQKTFWAKVLLFVSVFPLAILGNIFRVFLTAIIVHVSQADIMSEPVHSILGLSVFAVTFILLFVIGAILRKVLR